MDQGAFSHMRLHVAPRRRTIASARVLVDGIGYAEVERGLERHGLDVAEGVVPQLELGIQRHLLFAACCVLLIRNCEFLLLAERHMPPPGFYFAVSLTCVASRLQIYI